MANSLEPTEHMSEVIENNTQDIENRIRNELKKDSTNFFTELDWENIPSLTDLKGDMKNAKEFHDAHMIKVRHWRSLLEAPALRNEGTNQRSTVQPKLIRKMAEWRYSSLSEPFLTNDDLYAISPRTWEDRQRADTRCTLLNYQIKEHVPFTSFIADYIRSLVNDGTVITKQSWISTVKTRTVEKDVYFTYDEEANEDPKFMEIFETALALYDVSPSEYLVTIPELIKKSVEEYVSTGYIFKFGISSRKTLEEEYLEKNNPYTEVVPVDNIIVDPSCGADYSRAKFIVHKFESSLGDLKADGRYSNLDMIDTETNKWNSSTDHKTLSTDNFNFSDITRKRIAVNEYWGYWDIHGKGELEPIVAAWVGDVLIRLEVSPYSSGKLPFSIVPYMPISGSFYGEPDAELLEDNQRITGAITRGIIDTLAKNAAGQKWTPIGMLDAANKTKAQKGQDVEYNPNFHPQQHIWQETIAQLPESAFGMLQYINQESESLTGVKVFSEGLSANSLGKVATAVRGVLSASAKREGDILNRAAEGILEIGRQFLAMDADLLEEEEFIRITNRRPYVDYNKEFYKNHDFKISIMTAEEVSARSQDLGFILQTVGPNMDPGTQKILLTEFLKINKLPDAVESLARFEPQPSPEEQMMRELALQEQFLKIEQAKMNLSKDQINNALTEAKVLSEQMKAAKLQSEAQGVDLDMMKDLTGQKQREAVERIAAQAESQARLAVTQSQLRREENRETFGNELAMKDIDMRTREND